MAPVLNFDRSFVFTASGDYFPFRFADVFLVSDGAFKTVHTVLFVLRWAPFVFCAEYVLEFGTGFKSNIATGLFTYPVELIGYAPWDVWDGNKRFS